MIKVFCDACGNQINGVTRDVADQAPPFVGQTLVMDTAHISSGQPYLLELHLDCAQRILKAIGQERKKIMDEKFIPGH